MGQRLYARSENAIVWCLLSFVSDMGAGEMGTPTKTTKTSTPQPSGTTPMYPEWAAAFQYYNTGTTPLPPPGYFPSTVGSGPQPHPYMWGAQPFSPYGTPPAYAAMYPHGGIYPHPSMAPVATCAGTDPEGKSTDGKKKSPTKKSRGSLGSLGMLTGKGGDTGKANIGSMNGVYSQSGESGSEGSTEGSDANSQNDSQGVHKGSFDEDTYEAPASHVVNSTSYGSAQDVNHAASNPPVPAMPISIAGKQVVGAGPLTNLHIGMDYWSGGTPSVLTNSRGKRGAAVVASTAMIPTNNMMVPARDGVPSELWLQDERELKRQRRKQSNRESARRSRLRKQAECEDLAARVEKLATENSSLRSEITRLAEECKKLSADNTSLQEQLQVQSAHPEMLVGVSEKHDTTFSRSAKRDGQEGL